MRLNQMMGIPIWNKRHDPLRFRGLFNDAGGGTAGGGTGTAGSGTQGTAGTGGSDGQGGTGTNGGGNVQPFASFATEAELKARLEAEGKNKLEALAKELGFETVADMQAAAKAKRDADEKAKSDLEKAQEVARKAEAEKKSALEAANQRLINAEIKIAAQAAGFVDPADAVALVERASIKVDDAGNVTGAKEAVEALAKAKAHLVSKAGGTNIGGGSNPGTGGGGSQLTPEQLGQQMAQARNQGARPQVTGFDPWAQASGAPANGGNVLQQLMDLIKGGK